MSVVRVFAFFLRAFVLPNVAIAARRARMEFPVGTGIAGRMAARRVLRGWVSDVSNEWLPGVWGKRLKTRSRELRTVPRRDS